MMERAPPHISWMSILIAMRWSLTYLTPIVLILAGNTVLSLFQRDVFFRYRPPLWEYTRNVPLPRLIRAALNITGLIAFLCLGRSFSSSFRAALFYLSSWTVFLTARKS